MRTSTRPGQQRFPLEPERHCDDLPATISERFAAFDSANPWVYTALERLTAQRLATGARRIGMKALFEALRWQQPHGIRGLNNDFTCLYARKLVAHHPEWAAAFELRRRRAR